VALKTKSKFLCYGFSLLVLVKAELQIPLSGGMEFGSSLGSCGADARPCGLSIRKIKILKIEF
jgi:hypothetical protein